MFRKKSLDFYEFIKMFFGGGTGFLGLRRTLQELTLAVCFFTKGQVDSGCFTLETP